MIPRPQTATTAQLKPQTLTTLGFSQAEAVVIAAIAAQVPAIGVAITAQLAPQTASAQIAAAVPAAETRAAIAAIISAAAGLQVPAIASAVAASAQLQVQAALNVPAVSAQGAIASLISAAASVQVPAVATQVRLLAHVPEETLMSINAAVPGAQSAIALAALLQMQLSARVPAIAASAAAQVGVSAQVSAAIPAIASAIAATVIASAQLAIAVPAVASVVSAAATVSAQLPGVLVPGIATQVVGAIASGYGPLTLDYQSRVVAAGGTISTAGMDLVEAFFYSSYNDGAGGTGRVSDFSSLFPFLWMPASNFAGILVPLLGASFTNTGFVSGDWNIQSGLQGGTGKFLNSNVLATAGGQNNMALGAWVASFGTTIGRIYAGVRNTSSTYTLDLGYGASSPLRFRARINRSDSTTTLHEGAAGFVLGRRLNSTSYRVWSAVGGVLGSSLVTSSTSGVPPALPIYIGAINAAGSAAAESDGRIGAALFCSTDPTDAQINILYNAMAAFASGRSSL